MPIFYLLHNCIPSAEDSNITHGSRNGRLFLFGMFFYVVLYVVLKNMQLNGAIHEGLYDSIFVGLIVMFLADGFVMSWIYKDFFGRSITNEVGEVWGDKEPDYEYNDETHKYNRKQLSSILEDMKNIKDEIKDEKKEIKSKSSSKSKKSKSSKLQDDTRDTLS